MDLIDLQAVGMPIITIGHLHLMQEKNQLASITLPDFLALWKRDESMRERPEGELYVLFGDYVQMQAILGDIGGTVSSTSHAETSELLQLTPVPNIEPEVQERLWNAACESAATLVASYGPKNPRSIHHMVATMTYMRLREFNPRFANASTFTEIDQTEMPFDEIGKEWRRSAYNAFNIGLAIALNHADFYNEMEQLHQPSGSNGYHQSGIEDSITPLKREYQLTQCRIWASVCRPDLAHLLEGP